MKILFWVPYPSEGPSNRYRVEQYLPYLKSTNIEYCLRPFWRSYVYGILYMRRHYFRKILYFILGTLSRLWDILTIARYDLIFIHRESYPIGGAFFEKFLKIMGKPFIFDFDDAIFLKSSSPNNSFIERFKSPAKIKDIVKMSRGVIAGNIYLANFASQFNKNVFIIPTAIDTDKYYPCDKKGPEEIVVGWIGTFTTLNFVNSLNGVFRKLSSRFNNLRLKVIGGIIRVDGVERIISKQWSEALELEDLRSFDIGIMPMPDNEWTRGKCGFKAILYMSMGIPCVCSPIGVNKEIITDGLNGFLASSEEEWVDKLSLLAVDAGLREKIGREGRRTVEEKYSVKANVNNFLNIIQKRQDKNGAF